jgi:lysozyme
VTPDQYTQLQQDLRADEGDRATAYRDSLGVLTIGVGHNLGVPLSPRARQVIFDDDCADALVACQRSPWWAALDPTRQVAVANLMFNLGPEKFATFRRMVGALRAGDYPRAAAELLDSRWATQVQPSRRDRLVTMIQVGLRPEDLGS